MSASGDSVLPPNWDELAPLVDAVLDAPPERRGAIIDELCTGDPRRRNELQEMAPKHGLEFVRIVFRDHTGDASRARTPLQVAAAHA